MNVEESPEGLRIVIPSKGSWFKVLFLSVWLCGWAAGEVTVAATLLGLLPSARGSPGLGARAFLLFWLTLWTFGGAAAINVWVWNVCGKEIVLLDGTTLSLSRRPIPLPKDRRFDWAQVRALRVSPSPRRPNNVYSGVVAFDYGAETVRFGDGLDEAEAQMVIDHLQTRSAA